MNGTVLVIECVVMMAVFGCLVFGLLLINPLTFVSDYPPEIQERYYRSQHKEATRAGLTKIMAAKKMVAIILCIRPLCVDGPYRRCRHISGRIAHGLRIYPRPGRV